MTLQDGDSGRVAGAEVFDVEVSSKTRWRFLRLVDGDGHLGLGEFSYDGAPADLPDRILATSQELIGRPARPDSLETLMPLLSGGLAQATCYSALDQALSDLASRRAGMPLWRYLGCERARDRVRLYANINRRTEDRSPKGFAASAESALSAGFRALKVAPFDGLSPALCGTQTARDLIDWGLERIAAVGAAGNGVAVMVDCHWRFDARTAAGLLPDLADLGVIWFECPVPETEAAVPDLKNLRRLANGLGIRLAGLETQAAWAGFKPFVEAGAYDVIMPDIKHAGGHGAILEISDKAAAHGVAVSLHNPTGPVAHLASVHLTAALPGDEALELQFDESPLFWTLTDPAPPPCDGTTGVPTGIGLGADLR